MFVWIFNLFLFIFAANSCIAVPNQVIIIRHAEKFDTPPMLGQLSPKGLRRAGALASFFTLLDPATTNPAILANGLPSTIFASRPVMEGTNNTIRCIQTITPTASTLQIPIHSPYGLGQEKELVSLIMNDPRFEAENVLICWHHPKIDTLIYEFGYNFPLPSYPADRFDLVWLMTFPAPAPPATLVPVLQKVLFDDPTTAP